MTSILDRLGDDSLVDSGQIRSYLASDGWSMVRELPEMGTELWEVNSGTLGADQIAVPTDSRFLDHRRRLADAVERICDVYGWDLPTFALMVQQNRSDLLLLRADQLTRFDSIPLKQAESLIKGSVKMLSSAAWATYSPRASLSGRKPNSVKQYVTDDLRMGHTQRGSFIITILSRVEDEPVEVIPQQESERAQRIREADEAVATAGMPADNPPAPPSPLPSENLDPGLSDPDQSASALRSRDASQLEVVSRAPFYLPPFQRRVMSTLANALEEVRLLSLENARGRDRINRAVQRGVSAQLCESLESMTSYVGLRSLDMSFNWSAIPRIDSPGLGRVVLNRDSISGLERLPGELRQKDEDEPSRRETITGRVSRLEQIPPESPDGDETEVATISGVVGRRKRRQLRVALTPTNRGFFISAYQQRLTIDVSGESDRDTRGYWLRGEISFQRANY